MPRFRENLATFLAIERNIAAVSIAMLLLGLAEHLWKKFIPKFLEALGAPILAIGFYGTAQDLVDGVYQYPGGWLSDRFGRRKALMILVAAAGAGYLVYAITTTWIGIFAGLLLVMAWSSMASPTLFAVVGDALPRSQRAMGFTFQAILKRIPIAIAPILGGIMIAEFGVVRGIRLALVIAVILSLVTIVAVSRVRLEHVVDKENRKIAGVWRSFPPPLRALLVSDIFIRICEGMVDVFVVLYALNIVRITPAQFGVMIAIQMTTSIAVYIPAAHFADRLGKKPFVIATFLAFALFPLAVVMATSVLTLAAAYVVGGLREIGEPSRKALIVDLADPALRGRSVGLYYLVRGVTIAPAAAIGGYVWRISPQLPFFIATAIGLIGTIVFAFTVRDESHGR